MVLEPSETSCCAVIDEPAPRLTTAVVLTKILESAVPTATRPPPPFADDADTLPIEVAWIETSFPESTAFGPTLVFTVGVECALVVEEPTCTRPPPIPLAAEVTMPSPEGAAASARAPPTPSSCCVPVEVD